MDGERGGPKIPSNDDIPERNIQERLDAARKYAEPQHDSQRLPSEEIPDEPAEQETDDKDEK